MLHWQILICCCLHHMLSWLNLCNTLTSKYLSISWLCYPLSPYHLYTLPHLLDYNYIDDAPTDTLSLSSPHQKREWEPHREPGGWQKQRPRDGIKWAGPQLVLCFLVSDQGQSVSVWTHRPWDISRQLHMTLRFLKMGSNAEKQALFTPFSLSQLRPKTVSPQRAQPLQSNFKRETENGHKTSSVFFVAAKCHCWLDMWDMLAMLSRVNVENTAGLLDEHGTAASLWISLFTGFSFLFG